MGVVTILLLVMLQAAVTPRATIVAKPSEPPRRNFRVVYYDESFLFAARNYGDARDAAGNTEPGLFVHSKERDAWVQITAISTTDGKFGKSTSDDPEASRKLSLASVGWDHTQFSSVPYVEQPLRTSGSIVFPERIEYDGRSGRYTLRYLSSWGVPSAETVLYIRRVDLIDAFAKTPFKNR